MTAVVAPSPWAARLPWAAARATAAPGAALAVPSERLLAAVAALRAADPGLVPVDLAAAGLPAGAGQVVYQLRGSDGARLQLTAEGGEPPPSLAGTWPAADWPEREACELFGARFGERESTAPLLTAAWRQAEAAAAARASGDASADGGDADGTVALPDPGLATPFRLDLRAEVRAGVIRAARACPGLTHSGVEALAERRPFAQLPTLMEALNEQAPFAPALAAVLAIEGLLGLAPPPRCAWVRTVYAEVCRLAAHCAWLAAQCAADAGLRAQALAVRDGLARFLAAGSGRRWATGVHRIGGIDADLPADASARLADLDGRVDALRRDAARRTVDSRGWRRRFAGVAALDAATAAAWWATGPVLRAAGVDVDVRRDCPYLAYGQLDFEVPLGARGDVVDRAGVRLEEMAQGMRLIRQGIDGMPEGPRQLEGPPSPGGTAEWIRHFELWMDGHGWRPPPGADGYWPTESADGELGVYLRADGTGRPRRAHLRSPSLYHFQVAPQLLAGVRCARAPQVVASLNIVAPEMDR